MLTTSSGDNSSSQLTKSFSQKYIQLPQEIETAIQADKPFVSLPCRASLAKEIEPTKQHDNSLASYLQSYRSQPIGPENFIDGLQILQDTAYQSAQPTALTGRHENEFTQTSHTALLDRHADPIEPLRERDIVALSTLFLRHDMPEIEADVSHRLLSLLPEPFWEENPFEFLKEFL